MQAATEAQGERLVYFAFDLLHHDGEDLLLKPLLERKARLADILKGAPAGLQYSDHIVGQWRRLLASGVPVEGRGHRVDSMHLIGPAIAAIRG